MKRVTVIHRFFLKACLLFLPLSTQLDAAKTIPIADGNMWVYNHSDTIKYYTSIISGKQGLFIMRMDSVFTKADSIFFAVTTSDSGVTNKRSVKKYMEVNDMLFLQDTPTGGWSSSSDEFITYTPHIDTNYNWHVGFITRTTYDTTWTDSSLAWSRHTDSSGVVVNGTEVRKLYTTDTSFSWMCYKEVINGGFYYSYSYSSRDTLRWLDSIGVFYHFYHYDSLISPLSGPWNPEYHLTETYSLLSFNGTPVSITPATKVKNNASVARQNPSNLHSKVIRLGVAPYRQTEPARYLNLLGRQLSGIQRAQLLINKDVLPAPGDR